MNKRLLLLIIFTVGIFLTGCSSILIEEDTVLTLSSETPQTASINSLTTDQPGKVCDMTKDRKSILSIGRNNSNFTIDSYQIPGNSLVNLLTSESRIYDVKAADNGFFYTKLNPANMLNVQIIWSTSDLTVERVITDPYENVSETIFAYGTDNVIFISNNNELVFSNSSGVQRRYELGKQIEVSEIVWSESNNTGFLTGRDFGNDYFTLYQFNVNDSDFRMTGLMKNVLDIDLSDKSDMLAFCIQEEDTVQAYIISDIAQINPQRQFKQPELEKVCFSDDENTLFFTKHLGVGIRSTLWNYDISSKNTYQLTSPLRIVSDIIPFTVNNEVFFSIRQSSYNETNDVITSTNYISTLVYTSPKNN